MENTENRRQRAPKISFSKTDFLFCRWDCLFAACTVENGQRNRLFAGVAIENCGRSCLFAAVATENCGRCCLFAAVTTEIIRAVYVPELPS